MRDDDENRPVLTNWKFQNFTDDKMEICLEFKNALYVSFYQADIIQIQVKNVNFFQGKDFNNTIE